jgi:hypothetical protein
VSDEATVLYEADSSHRVLRLVETIAPYAGDAYYLAIVPDSPQNIRAFVSETLAQFAHDGLELWDVSRWGSCVGPTFTRFAWRNDWQRPAGSLSSIEDRSAETETSILV